MAARRDERRAAPSAGNLARWKAVALAACSVERTGLHWVALTACSRAAQWVVSRAVQRGHCSVALKVGPKGHWMVVLWVGCWAGHSATLWAGLRAAQTEL